MEGCEKKTDLNDVSFHQNNISKWLSSRPDHVVCWCLKWRKCISSDENRLVSLGDYFFSKVYYGKILPKFTTEKFKSTWEAAEKKGV